MFLVMMALGTPLRFVMRASRLKRGSAVLPVFPVSSSANASVGDTLGTVSVTTGFLSLVLRVAPYIILNLGSDPLNE